MRSGSRIRVRPGRAAALLLLLVLVMAGAISGCLHAGAFLVQEDPLQPADAIFVLAGSQTERPLEAADLYLAGLAPHIVLTRDMGEQELRLAAARGVQLPSRFDITRQLLTELGVASDALVLPDRLHDSTADEADTLRRLVHHHGWSRVIVVSSKYHLRRTALACRRALRGTDVEVVMRASRYDPSTPARWWTRRSDIRWLVSEYAKLTAYTLNIQP